MRFDIFGRLVIVERQAERWVAYYPGEGKRRPADIAIPSQLTEDELLGYLADLFHELARPGQREACRLA
jgi:hypothetical protein